MKPIVAEITDDWIKQYNPCQEALAWWDKKEKNPIKILELLLEAQKYAWANWFIVRIMTYNDYVSYAVYAAEQVAYFWKDRYPKEYTEWKKWVDNGCPQNGATDAAGAAHAAYAAGAANAAYVAHAAHAAYAACAAYAEGAAYAAGAANAACAAYAVRAYVAGAANAAYAAGAADAAYAAYVAHAAESYTAMLHKILGHGLKLLKNA